MISAPPANCRTRTASAPADRSVTPATMMSGAATVPRTAVSSSPSSSNAPPLGPDFTGVIVSVDAAVVPVSVIVWP